MSTGMATGSTDEMQLLAPGTAVGGRFVVDRFLASGGMGAVYRAHQTPLNRLVALKVMHPGLAGTPSMQTRFFHEALAVSKLSHPNTITVYDYGTTDQGDVFIAMEFVDGASLSEQLAADGPMPLSRVVPIAIQIAQSLSEAHTKAIIHRDLKLDNVMTFPRGDGEVVKVLDFGIAKLLDAPSGTTRDGVVCGTPAYMAPEQARGDEVDGRADLYSLGCCLYELLTGEKPYQGDNALHLMMQHNEAPIPNLPRRFPSSLNRFLQRVLAKDPRDRPSDAQTFTAELMAVFLDASAADLARSDALRESGSSPWIGSLARPVVHTGLNRSPSPAELAVALANTNLSPTSSPQPDSADKRPTRPTVAVPALDSANKSPGMLARPPLVVQLIAFGASLGLVAGLVAGLILALDSDDALVTFESVPVGATVAVDGRKLGVTPLEVAVPHGEPKAITLNLPGYEEYYTDGVLFSDDQSRFFARLTRRTMELSVTVPHDGARVRIGSTDLGVLAADRPKTVVVAWPLDQLDVVVEHPDFQPLRQPITRAMARPKLQLTFAAGDFVATDESAPIR